MRRFFNTLEGDGKGTRRPLASNLMIVGRSKNADLQIEDALVSRRHLEIRVEGDTVFVENKSNHGSFLNGKALVGVVSLNPGDVLDLGHTKLSYGEEPDEPAPSSSAGASVHPQDDPPEEMSAEIDGTRIGGAELDMLRQREREPEPDATRAVAADRTRMLNPAELPNWVAQEKKKAAASSKGRLVALLFILVLLLAGGAYWWLFGRGGERPDTGGSIAYSDSLYGFGMAYPLDWSKVTDQSGVIEFGFGGSTDAEWARLSIRTDRDAAFAFTGLTDGFKRYEDVLKGRYPDFELVGSKKLKVNGASVMFYGFATPKVQGKGIYLLNAESRIVAECISSKTAYPDYASVFSGILQSFHFSDLASQEFIDFPLPDDGMRQLALADPGELSKEIAAHAQLGDMLFEGRDVKPENLYASLQEYRGALQLAIAPPQRVAAYQAVAEKLLEATREFDKEVEHERFLVNLALRNGDADSAFWEANKLMQMVPDKTDPVYQEAHGMLQSIQRPRPR